MIKLFLLMLTMLISLTSCKSIKKESRIETKTEMETNEDISGNSETHIKSKKEINDFNISSFGFGSNIILHSNDVNVPAIITEYREGKPYRSLEVKNGTYTEKMESNDTIVINSVDSIDSEFQELVKYTLSDSVKLDEVEYQYESMKSETSKINTNIKLLFIILILVLITWISDRSGLFGLFKRLFK